MCFFRRAAQFRESLTAKDTPGDRRNTHYASSLHAIVAYVETLPDDHPTLEMLAQCDPLYDELERFGVPDDEWEEVIYCGRDDPIAWFEDWARRLIRRCAPPRALPPLLFDPQ
ncbi:MAG: hypothetical protein GX621_17920 [Pirellulaceae bacterium]|nr:hypothetical protein [Pirellulaceae bacterium]